ncbi:peptidoglycan bridge formation glycyltransferase FemA/FemB family protein [Oerskovia sp. M15]
MAAMGKSTRYDIRKAGRSGLDVRRVTTEEDVHKVLGVYRETAERAGFALHDDEYYLDIHRELGEHSVLVAAFDEGEPVAFVWCVASATTSFELYGGINDAGRKLRANAPVKWHAIELAQQAGLTRYDMNGLLNDGISEFKRSFAQHDDELVGSIDVPFSCGTRPGTRVFPPRRRSCASCAAATEHHPRETASRITLPPLPDGPVATPRADGSVRHCRYCVSDFRALSRYRG